MVVNPRVELRASGLQNLSYHLLASAAVVGLVLGQAAYANPVGGKVASGTATISTPASGTLQIDQTTKIVIINWNSFNIAGGETTKFVQPNASSIAVNRIGGSDPSTILGSLLANGRVVLINGNGILFGPGSKINVGSLLATTSDASDADIASGKAKFDKAGNPNAQIINQGSITAASDGMVGLIAPAVSNSGTITAKLGTVQLGASNVFTVDFTGDGLVSFPVDGNVVAAAIGKNGKPVEALVVNDGKISGGTVMLTARAAANLVTNVISMKGEIVATAAHDAGGKIVLDGGQSGDINVAGTLDASGTSGGKISVVSQGTTSISGAIKAKNTTGKGGFIETSGHNLSIAGTVNAGQGGNWLLDPYDLTVDATAASTINTSLGAGTGVTLTTAAGSASGPGTQNASGHGDIIINSAISWSTAAAFSLSAYRDIDINANITASGAGALSLTTGTGTTGDYNIAAGKSISFTGASTSGASLSINDMAYTLLYNMSALQAINASDAALQGHYALAKSLNASSTSGWVPIGTDGVGNIGNSNHGFAGIFVGLGHTISNLTVNFGSNNDAGLFGYSSGTIRDIGMVGGSVTGGDDVGGLLGVNVGTISNAYATGAVSGTGDVGGLAGSNHGTISNTYATGAVSATGDDVGGLVGNNGGGGTITQSHASGAVSGDTRVGGLVGHNDAVVIYHYVNGVLSSESLVSGAIMQSYATGAVSGSDAGGLVGINYGTISNAYATGTVTGGIYAGNVGGLVGTNSAYAMGNSISPGTITQSYATGSVNSGSGGEDVGGLVGENDGGAISKSYALGAVSSTANFTSTGGLAGGNSGSISGSYAMGAVSVSVSDTGGALDIGGLVGVNGGSIADAYATGAVNGSESGGTSGDWEVNIGGLAGTNNGGTLTKAYWDTQTSGRSTGLGTDNNSQSSHVTGKTTAQLQGVLPSGFSSSTWGTASGLFPYFKWQYSTTPQAISGYAYSNAGVTPLASTASGAVTVSALVNGTNRGNATTGANGYYYLLVSSGTFSGSQQLLTYLNGGTTVKANTYVQSPTGNVTSANLYGGYLRLISGASTTSSMFGGLSTALGSNTGSNFLYAGGSIVSGKSLDIESSASGGLTINSALNLGTGTLILNATGAIAESGSGKITATTLTGSSHGAVALNAANAITNLGAFTTNGNYAFVLTDAHDLTVGSAVNAGTAGLTLTTTGTGNDIIVNNTLHGGTVKLASAGVIGSNSSGKITATTLTGSSHGAVTVNAANAITNLGTFTTGGNYAFALTDAHDLTVSGAVNAGTAGLTLTTTGSGNDIVVNNTLTSGTVKLASAATIGSNSAGKITATTLTGSSHGTVTLSAANTITNLGAFTTNNGNFALTDATLLTTTGTVNAGTHTITLKTTGATSHGIAIKSHLTTTGSAGVVTLTSAGNVTENTTTGAIITHKLNVTAKTGISLTSPSNNITVLGTHTTVSGPNNIHL